MPPTPLRLAIFLALLAALVSAPAQAEGAGLDVSVAGVVVKVGGGNDSAPLEVGLNLGGGEITARLGDGGGHESEPGDPDPRPRRIGQQGVLQAVRAHRVLPLEDILTRAPMLTEDQIIDAQLIGVRGILLYQIKVLGKGGDVSQHYFYARSGLPVRVH